MSFIVCGWHRHSQYFLWGGRRGVHLTENLMTFFSHHPLLHGHIHQTLPPTTFFCLICRGAPHQIQPIFALFQQKCLEKNFSRRPVRPALPLATPMVADHTDNLSDDAICYLCKLAVQATLSIRHHILHNHPPTLPALAMNNRTS